MGIRQNRLARMLGMDETLLSKMINGFREPTSEMRSRIAVLLDRDEEWLFERVREISPDATLASQASRIAK